MLLSAAAAFVGILPAQMPKFASDWEFLQKHTDSILLRNGDAMVAVTPQYQGRVMTSSGRGLDGDSFGWINYELIESGETGPHMNAFGGEDRIWLGPEGGQYSIFFKDDDPFDLDHWQTPALIDTDAYTLGERNDASASFHKSGRLVNKWGTVFDLRIDRTVRLLDRQQVAGYLGVAVPGSVSLVGYQSENELTNTGENPWIADTGLLSIWILGMMVPTDGTTIVIPIKAGSESALGPRVIDNYFGRVPAEWLIVEDDILFFRGDGNYRSKIGITPQRVKPICGSYDSERKILTLVQFSHTDGISRYVNSMWEYQADPYGGDVVNSYNDGPLGPGLGQMGPFYELETSSPALALDPGETGRHVHRTIHLQGDEAALDRICQSTLGVNLERVKTAFAH